jgi:pilus assembly protein Flp/PilA
MFSHLKKFLCDESGPTAVEYGVMLALIVIACIGSVNLMAARTADSFDTSATELASVFGS